MVKSPDNKPEPRPTVQPARAAEGPDSPRPRVLVVDDDASLRSFLRKHLEPHYEFLEAARGDDALRIARAEIPDAIVSDLLMPGLDGFALCRALKSDPQTSCIPVILLTVLADQPSKIRAFESGADDYLTKPFAPAELLLRIRNRLLARSACVRHPLPASRRPPS